MLPNQTTVPSIKRMHNNCCVSQHCLHSCGGNHNLSIYNKSYAIGEAKILLTNDGHFRGFRQAFCASLCDISFLASLALKRPIPVLHTVKPLPTVYYENHLSSILITSSLKMKAECSFKMSETFSTIKGIRTQNL